MAFTAADVKNLREMTGVGMMDCKKALAASDGDMDKAVEYLREEGLAASAKKAKAALPPGHATWRYYGWAWWFEVTPDRLVRQEQKIL